MGVSIIKKKYVNELGLIVFLFVATLPMTQLYFLIPYRNIILLSLIILLTICNWNKMKSANYKGLLFIIWVIMSFVIGASTLYNDQDIMNFFMYIIISPYTFFILFNVILNGDIKLLLKSGIISGYFYIGLSILLYPDLYLGAYKGIFINSNMFGMYASFLSLCLLIYWKLIENKKSKFLILSLFLFTLALIPIGMSRLALLSFTVCAVILLYGDIFKSIFKFTYKRILLLYLVSLCFISLILIYFTGMLSGLSNGAFNQLESLINKNKYYSSNGDLTNGRLDIWKATLNDFSLLGHGENYFVDNFGLAAHNSFVQIYGNYGFIAGVFLVIFVLYSLYMALKLFINTKNSAPMVLIFFYICINMSESVFDSIGLGINSFFLMLIGILNSNKLK